MVRNLNLKAQNFKAFADVMYEFEMYLSSSSFKHVLFCLRLSS